MHVLAILEVGRFSRSLTHLSEDNISFLETIASSDSCHILLPSLPPDLHHYELYFPIYGRHMAKNFYTAVRSHKVVQGLVAK